MHPVVVVIFNAPFLYCNSCYILYVVDVIAVASAAGQDDVLHQFIRASELAEQVKLMKLVSLVLIIYIFIHRKRWQIMKKRKKYTKTDYPDETSC